MSNILVLGGSYMQSGLIGTAIRLQHQVTVLDRDENCLVANWNCLEFEKIDISDLNGVANFIDSHSFDACIAPVSDIGNQTLSKLVSKERGFLYNSNDTVIKTLNKNETRNAIKNTSISEIRTYNYTPGNYNVKLNYPVIVKPSICSASRGVNLVSDNILLKNAVILAQHYSQDGQAIIEGYTSNCGHR